MNLPFSFSQLPSSPSQDSTSARFCRSESTDLENMNKLLSNSTASVFPVFFFYFHSLNFFTDFVMLKGKGLHWFYRTEAGFVDQHETLVFAKCLNLTMWDMA